jgi:hypothetical protein
MALLSHLLTTLHRLTTGERDDDGFVTAEHLGVAALTIAALVVIVGAMQALGVDVVNWIRAQLNV